ncbi:MAG: hypothetical protein GEU73_13650 [Chloroflexi bacterium]|nr:hypothetical protein [Chloroflexota bacterium]
MLTDALIDIHAHIVPSAIAEAVNDSMRDVIAAAPDRFRALAYLPLQDPDVSVRALRRCCIRGQHRAVDWRRQHRR